ncbi:MAG: hypothetical protein ABEH38_01550 [Flavobacteriales bacterium]
MTTEKLTNSPLLLFFILLLLVSCNKEEGCLDPKALNYDPEAEKEDGSCRYEEGAGTSPSTYSFQDADLSPGKVRIQLLDRLVREVKKGANGSSIALQDLMDRYRNNGIAGNGVHDLEETLSDQDSLFFKALLQEIASRSGDPSSLVAGHFVSPDSIAYRSLIGKGLMGASFFRYSTDRLLEDLEQYAHARPEASSPTVRESRYDEAFALFGVPRDFNRSTSFGTPPEYQQGAWFWGAACIRTDSALDHLPAFMDAWIQGRWALTHEKGSERSDAIQKVERQWERTAGALMIRHAKRCIEAIDNNQLADRIQHWSELHALHLFLGRNSDGIISSSQHQTLRNQMGTSPNECSVQSMNDLLATLQNVYGFNNSALQAL